MIKKVLIANRGEIACRIIKTAKKLGIQTVAVYSEADRHALHVESADETIYLGVSLQETYLNAEKIIAAAQSVQADAIHPGYGFLAENYQFAEQCAAAGLIFIGPSAHVIKLMGLKDEAKNVVKQLGIPLLPGFHGENQDVEFLLKEAKEIGFPVLLKAAGGGGGKGMRIVTQIDEFPQQLAAAKRESLSSFSNDKIIIEKYLTHPRHIEIQIAADTLGNVVHLFERDCSIQRRYQKVVEEAPACDLSAELREKLYAAAIAIAKHIAYVGVGTIECLVEDESFYFMEMNTRLQVEHPVTELITQQDLVEWQFIIANQQPLPLQQNEIICRGHAIEARLCAEDPAQNYLPAAGRVRYLSWPEQIRVDTGIKKNDIVTVHYDSLLAKLISFGDTRGEAINQLAQALDDTQIIGIATNRDFLREIISLDKYRAGNFSTQFIPQHLSQLLHVHAIDWKIILSLASIYLLNKQQFLLSEERYSPWNHLLGFQLNHLSQSVFYFYAEHELIVTLTQTALSYENKQKVSYISNSECFEQQVIVEEVSCNQEEVSALLNGVFYQAKVIEIENNLHIFCHGWHDIIQTKTDFSASAQDIDEACIRAPIPGNIVAILVKEGDKINKGQPLVVMEAMKMEHTISAPQNGTVQYVHYNVKDQVEEGAEILKIEITDV